MSIAPTPARALQSHAGDLASRRAGGHRAMKGADMDAVAVRALVQQAIQCALVALKQGRYLAPAPALVRRRTRRTLGIAEVALAHRLTVVPVVAVAEMILGTAGQGHRPLCQRTHDLLQDTDITLFRYFLLLLCYLHSL